jgi:hypothetical protein
MMTQNYETPTSATHIHGIYTTPPLVDAQLVGVNLLCFMITVLLVVMR